MSLTAGHVSSAAAPNRGPAMMAALEANTVHSAAIKAAVKGRRLHIAPRLLVANAFTMKDVIHLAKDSPAEIIYRCAGLCDEQIATSSQLSEPLLST